ncbi:ParB family protein [Xenorhabdus bovienii]|uniref:ParB family protein n=1 Tax=Xenorhabdus bovienii TaxID=40576 RepID=UPI00237D1EF7|nr:ParB family protein [Xenorhabdus bovienii]MDE1485122.1 ParB family protein [Xenorhabdus bovienii]MDE9475985.1 ParB family protein [Xenorhabdus bovienii]MDE9528754.1 ParB family protein [Xenorhabdus bovienii]
MKKQLKNQLGDALLLGGHANNTPQSTTMPMSEMPMVLTLDELSPNPDNPRTGRNPRYDDIKTSIKARGLDTVPKVTRDPNSSDGNYIFSDGGNTRYQVLSELWEETGDERFYRIHCLFKPWPGRLQCIIGHLAENDMRGELTFIEKAKGVSKARKLFEAELEKKVTLRKLSSLLEEEGFPVHFSSISKMEDTLHYLYPNMPILLDGGMGRGQIESLLLMRSSVIKVGSQFLAEYNKNLPVKIFSSVCCQLDSPELFSLDVFRDELIGELVKLCHHSSLNYDRWLFELDPKKQKKGLIDTTDTELVQIDPQSENIETNIPESDIARIEKVESVEKDILESDVVRIENVEKDISESEIVKIEKVESVATDIHEDDFSKNEIGKIHDIPKKSEIKYQSKDETEINAIPSYDEHVTLTSIDVIPSGGENLSLHDFWPISPLLDDIEHIQREVFLSVFSLVDNLGLAEFVSQNNSTVGSSGFHVTMDDQCSASLALLKLLSDSETLDQIKSNVFHEVFIGSYKEPIFNDEHILQLMKIIRLLRRLRELQIKPSISSDEMINTDEYV